MAGPQGVRFGERKAEDYATGKKPEARGMWAILSNKWLWLGVGALVVFGIIKRKR